MMSRRLHKIAPIVLVAFGLFASVAQADKLSVTVGFFSLSAKTATSRASLSGVGAYQLAYEHALAPNFDLRLGYSLLMTKGIGGDMAFGFDFGANYFPLTRSSGQSWSSAQSSLEVQELWRPYVGLGFSQRNFQSLQSGFAGFGGWIGLDRAVQKALSLRFEGRYLMLSGPKSSTVNQMDIVTGVTVSF